MAARKSPRDLNAPDLVKRWRQVVNDHVMMGRDAHMLKETLTQMTPVQILLGMYRFKIGNFSTASANIPMFLRQLPELVEWDEVWAEIELATFLKNEYPPEYYIYLDLQDEESYYAFNKTLEARTKLKNWADQILA